ncbi:MAG: PAS domain-containing protein [Chitinophagaceae bacterium]
MANTSQLKILVLTGLAEDYVRLEQDIHESGIGVEGIYYAKDIGVLKKKWKNMAFSLIFFDPDQSGYTRAKGCLAMRRLYPEVPVIFIAAEPESEWANKKLKSRPDDYLVKGDYHKKLLFKTITSILERNSLRRDLRKSTERYDLIMGHCDYAIVEWINMNAIATFLSEGMFRVFGYKPTARQKSILWWSEKIHPGDVNMVFKSWQECIKNNNPILRLEYRLRCADGKYKFVRARGSIFYFAKKQPSRVLWVLHASNYIPLADKTPSWEKINDQQKLAEFIIQAHEKEREELSNKMLDNINQVLVASKMYIEVAINNEHPANELLRKSYTFISRTIEEIYDLSKKLLPPMLKDIGLKEAIEDVIYTGNLSESIKFQLTFDGMDKLDISYNKKLLVYRIIQEQVINISKHANATEARISVSAGKEFIHITISDNGVGFNPQDELSGKGFRNIISRTNYYQGSINILSEVGLGSTLHVSIPY